MRNISMHIAIASMQSDLTEKAQLRDMIRINTWKSTMPPAVISTPCGVRVMRRIKIKSMRRNGWRMQKGKSESESKKVYKTFLLST